MIYHPVCPDKMHRDSHPSYSRRGVWNGMENGKLRMENWERGKVKE
jgi:hypothetical protein